MKKILVVEDSPAMLAFEKEALESRFEFPVITAQSYQQMQRMLETCKDEIFVALADLVLPDAPHGEIVDVLTAAGIPTIVFTGQYNEELRQFIMTKPIVDYILKSNLNNFQYALRLVACIYENQFMQALVVDDSEFARMKIEFSLRRLQINVLHAASAAEAQLMLGKHPDIRLLITDYHMHSNANGIDLTAEIRQNYGNDRMIIIGYSSDSSKALPVEFLKKGANDYIPYAYSEEEFTLRVLTNLEIMGHLRAARDMAIKDFMTGLYNRRYLFEISKQLFHQVKRGSLRLGVAIIDIDFFKKINDEHGHDIGDRAIKHVSALLDSHVRKSDLLTRIGGEEFCLLVNNADDMYMMLILEKLRKLIEANPLQIEEEGACRTVKITISAGFTTKNFEKIDAAIKEADIYLYQAKGEGRNCIRC